MSIAITSPRESTGSYMARGRRQAVALLAVATLLGFWLGTSAPGVSPVATPPAPGTPSAAVPANTAPVPFDRPDPGGPGRGR